MVFSAVSDVAAVPLRRIGGMASSRGAAQRHRPAEEWPVEPATARPL